MLNLVRRVTTGFVAICGLLFSAQASAFTITSLGNAGGNPGDLCGTFGGTVCQPYFEISGLVAGDSFDLSWELDGSQILGPDLIPDFPTLGAAASFTVTSITATQVVFDITLDNTTDLLDNPVGFMGGIISFGMELDGYSSGLLSTAGTFLDNFFEENIAGGPGLTADFCAATNGSCNSGTSADAIQNGGSDTLQFTLDGTFNVAGITLRNFATKWQTNYDDLVIPDDPAVIAGNSSFEQPGLPGGVIPEPNTASLMLIGLAGLAWVGRSRGF